MEQVPKLKTAPLATRFGSGTTSAVSTNNDDQTEWMELPTRTWNAMNMT
jgi:hypothetical protein